MTTDLSAVHFDAQGLVPAVAQDVSTGDVLLIAFMNADALDRTLATGEAHFWSRSRKTLWRKGESSGHTLQVEEIRVNCEQNSLLLRVRLTGPGACHDGYRSCYYRRLASDGSLNIVSERVFDPEAVYGEERSHPLPPGTGPSGSPCIVNGEGENTTEHQPAMPGSSLPGFPLSVAMERGAGGEASLEASLRELYAGYVRLRDEDFTAVSQTSRLLRDPTSTPEQFVARAQEELGELEGVAAGTHRHSGTRDDLLLEASQVIYWLCLAAARAGLAYDDWQPHLALSGAGRDHAPTDPPSASEEARPHPLAPGTRPSGSPFIVNGEGEPYHLSASDTSNGPAHDTMSADSPSPFVRMGRGSAGWPGARGGAILARVVQLLAQAGVAPIEPVQRDLVSLRKRLAVS